MPDQAVTNDFVIERLEQAAYTMKRLPRVTVQGYGSGWPEYIQDCWTGYGYNEASLKLGPPTAQHIRETNEALEWLLFLSAADAKLVWRRANGQKWKRIAQKFEKSIRKLQMDYSFSIITIVEQLHKQPAKRCYPYKKLLSQAA